MAVSLPLHASEQTSENQSYHQKLIDDTVYMECGHDLQMKKTNRQHHCRSTFLVQCRSDSSESEGGKIEFEGLSAHAQHKTAVKQN